MCGVAGFIGAKWPGDVGTATLKAMTDTLIHRGPDGSGYQLEVDGAVGLGHRRLAIVDLTEAGRQPMTSTSGRYVITFNGEVYNHDQLRRELVVLGHGFRGHSDTEVMLAAFDQWGVVPSVSRFNGMFAFAVWDRIDRRFWLARDRMGKKPLYYACLGGALVFGSELKALACYPGFPTEIDRDAVCLYLRHNYVPAPYTVFRGVRKLGSGQLLTGELRAEGVQALRVSSYWSVADAYDRARSRRFEGSYIEAVDELDRLLRESVGLRMVADVPVGAFLSGGIDSSTVVAMMQQLSSRPAKSFTIGFEEKGYSEAEHAAAVARHLGTEHTELYLHPDAALDLIPSLPHFYDEPFADSSQLPTMLVSRLAREHVTVALSGDAGDELFCGYNRYLWWRKLWKLTHCGPRWPWRAGAALGLALSAASWNSLLNPAFAMLPRRWRHANAGDRIHKLSAAIREDDPARLYLRFITHWDFPEAVVIDGHEPKTLANTPSTIRDPDAYTEHMMYLDAVSYLPDDILVKVDRASMAVSLEARSPLLDHRIVEFAAALPLSYKLEKTRGKRVLRDVLYRYVPRQLVDRPKTGFGVPIDSWLRGPLREWAGDLLSEVRLRRTGIFRPGPVRAKWEEHQTGARQNQYLLWDVLMFEAWFESWRSKELRV